MKIKELINDKRKILKFTIIFSGILIVLVLSAIGVTWGTSLPKFCATCHIMKPEFATWQASDHSQVDCTTCHVDPGLISALKHKVVATKELYLYVTKKYQLPIQMTEEIPDSRCLQCHSLKRKVSPSYPDLNIPHQRHHNKGITCVTCHKGVAHGQLASRGLTTGGDLNKWDKAKGQQVMTTEFTIPKMQLCMDCHRSRGVTTSCDACHSGSMKPESHLDKTFKTTHGELAKKNIKYCASCHDYIKAPGVQSQDLLQQEQEDPVQKLLDSIQSDSTGTSYIDYAKTNQFCVACHKKKPPSHNDKWPFIHGQEADKDQQKCLVCHSPRTDVSNGATAQTACSSCHPSIHENVPWRVSHPIEIPPNLGILPALCVQCHVKSMCVKCHTIDDSKAAATTGKQPGPGGQRNTGLPASMSNIPLGVYTPLPPDQQEKLKQMQSKTHLQNNALQRRTTE